MALGINSGYSKRALMLLHPNIKVMRHPDHLSSIVLLWAHHEKMVAIDQSVVFLGGLDLAYGRWDDHNYRLTDLAPPETQQQCQTWMGKDYSNLILKDWVQLDKPFEDFIDRMRNPRMPWRDIGAVIHGKAARDASRHFIQRWNFIKTRKYKSPDYPYLLPKSLTTAERYPYTVPGCHSASVQLLRSVDRWSAGCNECSILGAYLHCISQAEHYVYIENQFFISSTDVRTIQNRIADAIVQRISSAHKEGKKFRVYIVIPLLPGFEGDIELGGGNSIQAILHFTYSTILGAQNPPCLDVSDPVSDHFFNEVWCQIALNNAALYDQVFRCLPSNAVQSHRVRQVYTSIPSLASTDPHLAQETLTRVRGHLVEFPLYFLLDESLLPPLNSKEGVIPTEVWT
ncbi:hypothetical protein GDO81_008876 [Engystomops pustulosus]|uniref:phospholipase D n=1 Tax=Engystomops pustulosus TaxID=76066 RepID=A0AAV7BNC1_ENGPU|nr:hypothetical protein GDO81_008876 [Engystomops pustulosus]